ncbi:MAG: hypothetical protein ACI9SX_001513 [Pseudoalteromonas tetraodonis]|jgi:hypothetical protein
MNNRTVIAADIAKNSFQCVNFINGQQVTKNRAFNRARFEKLISRAKPMKLLMETYSGAQRNYWLRSVMQRHSNVAKKQVLSWVYPPNNTALAVK